MNIREVVIVEAARTSVGRRHLEKWYYRQTHPNVLLGAAYRAVVERAGIDPRLVENVIAGCVNQFGPQGLHVARNAWLQGGFPIDTSATTIDLRCGSAQQAVNFSATQIATGVHDVVIAGGVEHMGMVSFVAANRTQEEFGAPYAGAARAAQRRRARPRRGDDRRGIRDHPPRMRRARRTLAPARTPATEEGRFEREMITMTIGTNGDMRTIVTDQGIRPDTNLEVLARLKPVFKEDRVVTAGTASQISDGAAAVLLMSREKAGELGVEPRARIVDQTTVGCDPVKMLECPIPATAKILERNRMSIDDIDLFEVNEAFALSSPHRRERTVRPWNGST